MIVGSKIIKVVTPQTHQCSGFFFKLNTTREHKMTMGREEIRAEDSQHTKGSFSCPLDSHSVFVALLSFPHHQSIIIFPCSWQKINFLCHFFKMITETLIKKEKNTNGTPPQTKNHQVCMYYTQKATSKKPRQWQISNFLSNRQLSITICI